MDPPQSKKRKIINEGSFLEQRYYILQSLGYYTEGNAEKLAVRESLENRFKEIVRPPTNGPPSMNILEVKWCINYYCILYPSNLCLTSTFHSADSSLQMIVYREDTDTASPVLDFAYLWIMEIYCGIKMCANF
jgi:hypothetical protein